MQPILFTRFSALGDVASSLRVVDAAAMAWPERDLTFVTHERYLSLVKLLRVNCDVRGYGRPESAFPDFWSLRRWIDQQRPLVIDLHGSTRTRVLRWMGDRRDWRVLRKKRFQRRSLCQGNDQALPADERVQQNQAGLLDLEMPLDRSWLVHPHPVPSGILLVPGAAWAWKRWSPQRFGDLARRLSRRGHRVQILLSSGDGLDLDGVDWGHAELLLDLPLMDCFAHLAGAQAVVSNDTGFAHVAEGLGRPVLVLIGPTDQRMGAAPQSSNLWARAVHLGLDCQPCSQKGDRPCRVPGRPCLDSLSVAQVEESLLRLIDDFSTFGHKICRDGGSQ